MDIYKDLEISILDNNFTEIDIIERYNSFIWTDKYNIFGEFEIYLGLSTDKDDLSFLYLQNMILDNYIQITGYNRLMIIENIDVKYNVDDPDDLIVKGRSLESILMRRVVYGQHIMKGNLQECIIQLLNSNIINPTDVNRKISNFTYIASTDVNITKCTVDTQFNGDSVYSIIENLCVENKIGFKITLNSSKQFVFELYYGVDRSGTNKLLDVVEFSTDMDNVFETSFLTSKLDNKNVIVVGGEGDGADKKLEIVGTTSGLDRREFFLDSAMTSSTIDGGEMTDEEYRKQLTSKGEEELKEHKIYELFSCLLDHTKNYSYGVSYNIGDIVKVSDIYGNTSRSRISELIIKNDSEGFSLSPTFEVVEEED